MNFSECLHQRQSDDSIAEPLNCLDFPKASQASGSFTCSFNFINKDNRPHKGLPKAAKPMVFLPSDSWSLTKKKQTQLTKNGNVSAMCTSWKLRQGCVRFIRAIKKSEHMFSSASIIYANGTHFLSTYKNKQVGLCLWDGYSQASGYMCWSRPLLKRQGYNRKHRGAQQWLPVCASCRDITFAFHLSFSSMIFFISRFFTK